MSKQISFQNRSYRETALSRRMRSLQEGFAGSGQRMAEYCRDQGVSLWKFRYWRRRLGFCARRGKGASPSVASVTTSPEFVRIGSLPLADTY